MVQRKAPDKLGIQAAHYTKNNHVKSEKKPSSSQSEMRGKSGAELKKIMKKSGSFKRSDFESLASSRRAKPRLENHSSKIKISDVSPPNYMKSTTSSTARKECNLQVSPHGPRSTSSDRNSCKVKVSSGSVHKPVKTLTKTCSLKPVRTLTKTSSMKSGRPLMKKTSRVALCPNQNVGRATCSSNLKDSKFPQYVVLNPGGTEAEGTSVLKVCPYTYCSLNGHHHAQLPPLKQFLSAKRRLIKTQKNMKLKTLSPPIETKLLEERNKDIDTGQMGFKHGDLDLIEEVNHDFFVEIYAPPREEKTESLAREVESLQPDELSCSELSFEEDLHGNCDLMEEDADTSMVFMDESNFESPVDSELDELNWEASYMDWEDEQYEAQDIDKEADQFSITDDESDSISSALHRFTDSELQHENIVCNELPANGVENDGSFDAGPFNGGNSELNDVDQISEIDLYSDLSSNAFGEPTSIKEDDFGVSSVLSEYLLEEPTATNEEKFGASKLNNDCLLEGDVLLEDEKSTSPTNIDYVQLVEEQECNSLEDEPKMDDGIVHRNTDIDTQAGHQELDFEDNGDGAEEKEKVEGSIRLLETNEDTIEEEQCEAKDQSISSSSYSEEQNDLEGNKSKSSEEIDHINDEKEIEAKAKIDEIDEAEVSVTANKITSAEEETTRTNPKCDHDQQQLKNCGHSYKPNRGKRPSKYSEESHKLNWQEPHYLSAEPDPEAEKVDLKHQMMDERKNAEEWMLDYALRQTVNKLAPARKRKVALLVEAFEMVAPLPKWENRLQHNTTSFSHPRFVQACS